MCMCVNHAKVLSVTIHFSTCLDVEEMDVDLTFIDYSKKIIDY